MTSAIQSIIFDKKLWTPEQALEWIVTHRFRTKKIVDITDRKIRFRIRDPKQFKRFITKTVNDGIQFIIGFY